MKLYEIPLRYQAFLDRVDENDGEITEDLESMLASIEDDLATKADAYAAMIQKMKYEEEAYREEIKRLTVKANASSKAQERLRDFLLRAMKAMDVGRVRGKRFLINRIVNKRPSITWASQEPIPERFRRYRYSLAGDLAHEVFEEEGSLPDGFKIVNTEYVMIR